MDPSGYALLPGCLLLSLLGGLDLLPIRREVL